MADLRMPDINEVRMAARLTRDPELTYIQNGTALCKFGIAQSRKFKAKSGDMNEETNFFNVTLWGNGAEWVGENIKKGQPVFISGRLRSNEWQDRDTGAKRTAVEIQADRVQTLEWNTELAGGGNRNQSKPKPREIEEPMPQDDIPF